MNYLHLRIKHFFTTQLMNIYPQCLLRPCLTLIDTFCQHCNHCRLNVILNEYDDDGDHYLVFANSTVYQYLNVYFLLFSLTEISPQSDLHRSTRKMIHKETGQLMTARGHMMPPPLHMCIGWTSLCWHGASGQRDKHGA